MDDYFIFNGKRSNMMGIQLQEPVLVSGAVPNVKEYKIPGRNGTLSEWDGSFENRSISASCFILSHLTPKEIREANAWLLGSSYKKLILSDDEEHFYMARVQKGIPEEVRKGILNPFAIDFTAKPQKFLFSGEREVSVSTSIFNPTAQDALPLIKITGSGNVTVSVGKFFLQIYSLNGTLIFDTETGNATIGVNNASQKIYAEDDIVLLPGENAIEITGNATVSMIPRWFEI